MKVEVKEAQSNEVDWTKNPQLVASNNGRIVLVSQDQSESEESGYCFNGTEIAHFHNDLGCYSTTWIKSDFKPFHGEITLKND